MSDGTFNLRSERPEFGEAPYTLSEYREVVEGGIRPYLGKNSDRKVLARMGEIATYALKKYGYLDVYPRMDTAVKAFQKNYGLKQDGKIGPVTIRNMERPRCGFPDVFNEDNEEMQRFLAVTRTKWNKSELTYYVDKYAPKKLGKSAQLALLKQAFASWEQVPIKLKFKQTNQPGSADIIISCEQGRKFGFDGRGGTLAWAYVPQGDDRQLFLVFDYDEIFVDQVSSYGEIRYLNVAAHEIGHTLGLLHTQKEDQLLFFAYSQNISSPQWEDKQRVQEIYGIPDYTTPTPEKKVSSIITVYNDGSLEVKENDN